MKIIAKIIGASLLLSSFLLIPSAHAQTSLDEIKARLEMEGITVVDYSSPTGQWGSLPADMIAYLTSKGIAGLEGVISKGNLESYFIGEGSLTDLRRQLAIAISEKSRLTIQEEIDKKQDEILSLQDSINNKENQAKGAIGSAIESTDEAAKNLVFKEVDFYYNYKKWGRLPIRIIGILEEAGYLNLQDVSDIAGGPDKVTEFLAGTEGLSADDIRTISDSIAILSASGERQLGEVGRAVANTMKNIVVGLAVIWIIYAGARMIFAQGDESVITEQKKAIMYGVIGLIAILLVDRGIDFLYGPAGVTRTELTQDVGFSAEVYGIITFIKALIGIIAIFFIIVSGVRMVFAAGEESEITKQKTALLWVGVGLILVAINEVVIRNIFIIPTTQSDQIKSSNVTAIINTIGSVLQFILGFVALIAFGILVYGAATMIANYGDEQMVEKSKKIIKNALIGIVVIISAYTLVATLVIFR